MMLLITYLTRIVSFYFLNYIPGMITCEEFEKFIVDYFEQDLSWKQKLVFEMHLGYH